MTKKYRVPEDLPPLRVPKSNDRVILVNDPDADEIVRSGEENLIVRNPDARSR